MKTLTTQEVLMSLIWLIFPVAIMAAVVLMQWFRTQERLRLIEKGVPIAELPPIWPSRRHPSAAEQAANFRVAGIVLVAIGLGLLFLFIALAGTISVFPKGVIAVSAIPFLLGVGFLIEYRLRSKQLGEREPSEGGAGRR
jgi:hypothetical protein